MPETQVLYVSVRLENTADAYISFDSASDAYVSEAGCVARSADNPESNCRFTVSTRLPEPGLAAALAPLLILLAFFGGKKSARRS